MWEIYSYGGGDFLRIVFNGVAQIFGHSNYAVAISTAALLGFLAVLASAAFMRERMNYAWIIGIMSLYMTAVVPKVTVVINDRVVPENTAAVDNIPFGIGVTASFFSQMSDWVTTTFETVFSLPNGLKYSESGFLFAQTLVEESTRFTITSPRLAENMAEFWKSCVFYDLLLGRYTWEEVSSSSNIYDFFKTRSSVSRLFLYRQADGNRTLHGCRGCTHLYEEIDNEVANATSIYGVRLMPGEQEVATALTKFSASMPVAYSYLTGLSASSANILQQNVLLNSLKRGLVNFASAADAPAAAQDFAQAKAESERKTTFAVMGKIAKKMLPMMKNIFEAGIYALFPIIILIALAGSVGKVALGYVKMLLWINLWPPLYAILNFVMAYYSSQEASAAVQQVGSAGLTLATAGGLGSSLSDYANIASSLSISIPMISWLCVNMSGTMLAGLAGRFAQSYESPASSAANQISSGKVDIGNTSYFNTSAFQANSAPSESAGFASYQGQDGVRHTMTSGGQYLDIQSSNLPVSIDHGSSRVSAARESHSQAIANEQAYAQSNIESNAVLQAHIDRVSDMVQRSGATSESWATSDKVAFSEAQANKENWQRDWSERNGLSLEDTKRALAEIYGKAEGVAGVKGSAGVDILGNEATKGVKAEATAGFASKVGMDAKHISKEDYDKVEKMAASSEYSSVLNAVGSAARNLVGNSGQSFSDSFEESITSALQSQTQSTVQYTESMRASEAASKSVENAEQISATIKQNGEDGFLAWTSEQGFPRSFMAGVIISANQGDDGSRNRLNEMVNNYVSSQFAADENASYAVASERIESKLDQFTGEPENLTKSELSPPMSREEVESSLRSQQSAADSAISDPVHNIADSESRPTIDNPLDFKRKEIQEKVEEQQDKGVWEQVMDRL